MGICISTASSEIHNAETVHGHENALVFFDVNLHHQNDSTPIQTSGSVYSREGSKGLNQDSAILYQGYAVKDGTFCGVFDGHGKKGHVVSEMVRNRLPLLLLSQKDAMTKFKAALNEDHLGKTFSEEANRKSAPLMTDDDDEDSQKWKEAITSAFKVMDKEIKLQEHLDSSCSGTTAAVAVKQGKDLIMANLGDSRAILATTTKNGIGVVQLTTDLKPGLSSEADRIRSCNGRVIALKNEPHIQRVWLPHEDTPGLAMSRAFGDFLLKDYGIIATPEISYRRLTSNDQFIVLATDGVWDVLSNDQVASMAWKADSEEAAARAVVEAATAAWRSKFPASKMDDCTAICLFLQNKQQRT